MAESTRNAEADEKILERARKRWKIADEAEEENRTKQVDDLKFLAASPDDPYQWPQTVLNKRWTSEPGGRPRGPASRSTSCRSTSARSRTSSA
jgi:hypothetical protein